MTAVLSFGLESPLPGFNEMEASRGHSWRAGDKRQNAYNVAKQDRQLEIGRIARAAARERGMSSIAGPVAVTLWWGPCRLDPDNQGAAVKFILDALVTAGIIPDDKRRTIRRVHHEFPPDEECARGFYVVVQLAPVDAPPPPP